VRRIYERSKGTYPIIGCGGIATPDDALEMINAGATLVQIGTEYIYGGGESVRNINEGLNERLRKGKAKQNKE
jgi:dihydroorotate dehydrogenase